MPNRILLALDGSTMDEAAFSQAERIAAGGAEIHLVHVVPSRVVPVGTPLLGMMDTPGEVPVATGATGAEAQVTGSFPSSSPRGAFPVGRVQIYDQTVEYLDRFRRRLSGIPGQDIVRTGDPADGILQAALMFNVDLIVMSTHARAGFARWFLGSVSQTVLKRSQLPVLLVRQGNLVQPDRLRRILVPLDGSAESRSILSAVKPIAVRVKAEILLLHVIERKWSSLRARPAAGDPRHEFQDLTDGLSEAGIPWQAVTAHGDPAQEILTHVRSRNADLIAMSTRAPSRLERSFGKTVSQSVLARSDRPVLLQMPVIHSDRSDKVDFNRRKTASSAPRFRT